MCMGWTWALYFCNEGTQSCIDETNFLVGVRDKQPCADLKLGSPLAASYVDNLTVVAGSRRDAEKGLHAFEEKAHGKKLTLHPGLIGKGLASL
eukprot:1915441-Karenia_brevis.AAC.1